MFRIKGRVPRKVLAWGLPTAWGAMAISYKLACPLAQDDDLGARVVTSAVFFAVGTGLIVHVRQALLRELRQVRKVAGAAQSALLRPLPARIGGLNVAAAQLSADRSACVGGDLYEVIATEHGVRAVMGDVRGHGIAAIGTVAAVLGSFREAVHDEPDLGRVLGRLDRALARHLRQGAHDEHAEEFVTVLLLEIGRDGEITILNCGHPWPYLLSDRGVEPLARADPLPPLGLFPLPAELTPLPCGSLLPGDALVLYTDGVEDARDARGRFFSLQAALIGVRHHPITPQAILRTLFTAVLRHTRGRQSDDIALLVLGNDRGMPACHPPGTRPATTNPQPTNHL
ncbi:PP2C family protein-serine/threonine phosphatase [Streptomyces sp. NPDC057623]|uniref:PP2C family protein-serine/threonine phosphatase n=1 Tax=Streptomyces sp. NPDC057623 TaxID=3346187 RepID=UPI0036AB4790